MYEDEPKTIPEALREAANLIEKTGWCRLESIGDLPAFRETTEECYCAVTSLTHTLSFNRELRIDAIEALADEVILGWRNTLTRPGEVIWGVGMLVGRWNDAQPTKEVVINKMRAIADKLDN